MGIAKRLHKSNKQRRISLNAFEKRWTPFSVADDENDVVTTSGEARSGTSPQSKQC
jgi:hypothetical protein